MQNYLNHIKDLSKHANDLHRQLTQNSERIDQILNP
jgi:hypothetical protein